ncbi:alpha-L-fucosidase [Flagellimonas onchidii]|uniref:alpha-L-fucosidase n=1 Tax=Flagellimonas onchidii TaxID=2562684 RepID=UPI001455FCB3|nr:alpha-L-fucosidase [Allomuricauda onchidii]
MKKIFTSVAITLLGLYAAFAQNKISNREGTRQIHLDFHTSELIENIGSEFSKVQFQEALKTAKVNSINIFSKGHHGWSYYETKVGKKHPHLNFDLLKEQIEACHEIGVRAQAYYTIGWSAKDAREHPEWIIKDKNGKEIWFGSGLDDDIRKGEKLYPFYSWATLSPEGGYLELILAEVEELAKNYDLDGFWFDIVPFQYPNYSELGMKDLKANGVDINDAKAVERHHIKKMKVFLDKTREIVKKYRPDASIFYNWTTHFSIPQSLDYQLEQYNTKLDLEDLPTTWDGYDLFPLRAKYYGNLDMDYVAMSGKFHTAWGEFGGFKHKDAIWYEAASMVAFGANVNFGDQLHPSGKMDMGTYQNIGYAFDYVEKIEDYGIGADHEATVGMWFANKKEFDEGLTRMLLENQINFVMASNRKDWSGIEVVILSGGVELGPTDVKRLQNFLDNGGKLLVMGKSALDKKNKKFHFDLGVKYKGEAAYDVDYTIVGDKISKNLVRSPFLNYEPSFRVETEKGTEVLAHLREPFFNRRINSYSSHQNTPYQSKNAEHPAVTKKGNIVFIASDLSKGYFELGARVHRDLFSNSLSLLRTSPMVEVDLPSAGRINLLHQPDDKRYVLHLLYASPHQRGQAQVIEDIVPLYDVPVSIDLNKQIKKIYAVPSMKPVAFEKSGTNYSFNVEKLEGHTGIVFEY